MNNEDRVQKVDIRTLLDSLRAIAQEGLSYAQNEYDKGRYQKLLDLASGSYASFSGMSDSEIKALLTKELGSITPKLGIDVAVMNTNEKILLVRRSDDRKWSLPCGWADVEETPFQTARRETLEETGLSVNPIGYIAISQKGPRNYPGFVNQVNICVAVEKVDAGVEITLSDEHTEYAWIGEHDVMDWHPGHERLPNLIFKAYKQRSFIQDVP